MTCAILVAPGIKEKKNNRQRAEEEIIIFTLFFIICMNKLAHTPVEQLQGHSVSVVMGHQVDPLVAQTQVGHQRLHYTGLLEDGVPVRPLGLMRHRASWRKNKNQVPVN